MKVLEFPIDSPPEGRINHSDSLFFDIETTGLSKEKSQVYLIGCAFISGNSWIIRQYLAESALDERDILEEFLLFTKNFKRIIHFNGLGFDVPYIDYKAEFYGFDTRLSLYENFDIYREIKPLKKLLGLERLNQKSIELFLGIAREDKMSGGELISYYFEFERTADERIEKLLLQHNFDDVLGMMKIPVIFNYFDLLNGDFIFDNIDCYETEAKIAFKLKRVLPVDIEKNCEYGNIKTENEYLRLTFPVNDNIARIPIEDYKNYYYMPQEDNIIHKNLAKFIDKERREKATRENCFLRFEISENINDNNELFRKMACTILKV